MNDVVLDLLAPASRICGEDAEETACLKKYHEEARCYLLSHSWCNGIRKEYFAGGIGGIIGLFLFEIEPSSNHVDSSLWVVTGDLPSAYFVTDEAKEPKEALRIYSELMEGWAQQILSGSDGCDVYPVDADATVENARNLLRRLTFLKAKVIPNWNNPLESST